MVNDLKNVMGLRIDHSEREKYNGGGGERGKTGQCRFLKLLDDLVSKGRWQGTDRAG